MIARTTPVIIIFYLDYQKQKDVLKIHKGADITSKIDLPQSFLNRKVYIAATNKTTDQVSNTLLTLAMKQKSVSDAEKWAMLHVFVILKFKNATNTGKTGQQLMDVAEKCRPCQGV